jgi:hypothetical protein
MADANGVLDFTTRKLPRGLAALKEPDQTGDEACCPAFGYVRGLDKRALAVEFRFRDGNSDWFAYSLLGSWRHNPSVGVLLKFAGGDLTTYVLIRGSNLNAVLPDREINLTDQGLQRHRITFIREMDEDELRKAGESEPTIDRIMVAEFDSTQEAENWLKTVAPVFARASG